VRWFARLPLLFDLGDGGLDGGLTLGDRLVAAPVPGNALAGFYVVEAGSADEIGHCGPLPQHRRAASGVRQVVSQSGQSTPPSACS